ncbi:dihydroxyacetone kinase phosphoryl donor subunit DhaM [Arthrobacter cupressi]|uniref:Phosphocarrier protein HPr n=1 Tax=Arthrobacter cupressi TaxID=1045773 RepID=A0A1G8NKK7_9MICC|nr:dihydroxyacetone kinase phosphoryl donor subunit DhaM [Arthrobacter cupressi]NYD78210.1 PTS hybrid protein [Arthrobacter cupressi]SDI80789.1 PTS hybrid protein [Arthrobacter cupressi]
MTVALVVVSHSARIAEGAVELAGQMAPDVQIFAAGGTEDGRIGTSFELVLAAFESALDSAAGAGVVVLTDLGSAVMTAEAAVEFCSAPQDVLLADAPLVEGLVAAGVAAQGGADAAAVKGAASAVRFGDAGGSTGVVGPDGATPDGGAQRSAAPAAPRESGEFVLVNAAGIHARPAARIAGGLAGLDAEVTVNGVDGTSVMELMALAVGQGGTLTVEARGKDAAKAVAYVRRLVEEGFGEK